VGGLGARHSWRVTGGYDAALDGPEPRWGRLAVECGQCGETRRIWRGLPLSDPGLTSECPGPAGVPWAEAGAFALPATPAPDTRVVVVAPAPARLDAARGAAAGLAGVAVVTALAVLWVACLATGAFLALAVCWGAVMAGAGLACWCLVGGRRPTG
jgi:hypothetical protein